MNQGEKIAQKVLSEYIKFDINMLEPHVAQFERFEYIISGGRLSYADSNVQPITNIATIRNHNVQLYSEACYQIEDCLEKQDFKTESEKQDYTIEYIQLKIKLYFEEYKYTRRIKEEIERIYAITKRELLPLT